METEQYIENEFELHNSSGDEISTYYSDTANSAQLQYKAKLGDKYGIIKTLGHGATATVVLGISLENEEQVAIKILKDNVGQEILAEIASLSIVKGLSNIIKVIEFSSALYTRPSKLNAGQYESKQVNYIVT